jgi:hypothetical protein
VTRVEVADSIWKMSGLARKSTIPDQRDLKYKLMNRLTKATSDGGLPPEQVCVVLRDGRRPATAAKIEEVRARP